jgi:hypothetical protein
MVTLSFGSARRPRVLWSKNRKKPTVCDVGNQLFTSSACRSLHCNKWNHWGILCWQLTVGSTWGICPRCWSLQRRRITGPASPWPICSATWSISVCSRPCTVRYSWCPRMCIQLRGMLTKRFCRTGWICWSHWTVGHRRVCACVTIFLLLLNIFLAELLPPRRHSVEFSTLTLQSKKV